MEFRTYFVYFDIIILLCKIQSPNKLPPSLGHLCLNQNLKKSYY